MQKEGKNKTYKLKIVYNVVYGTFKKVGKNDNGYFLLSTFLHG